jgi:hypothetical protein
MLGAVDYQYLIPFDSQPSAGKVTRDSRPLVLPPTMRLIAQQSFQIA